MITTIAPFPYNEISTQMSVNALINPTKNNSEKITNNIIGIQNLPTEIHYKIANHLNLISYANLRETCKLFSENLESFQVMNRMSTNKNCQGELKEGAVNMTQQRLSALIKNNQDMMTVLTNLRVSIIKKLDLYVYSINFKNKSYLNEEKKLRLYAPLLRLKNLFPRDTLSSHYRTTDNIDIKLLTTIYDFLQALQDPYILLPSLSSIKTVFESLQSESDKNNTVDKYIIAAIIDKTVKLCEESSLLNINKATLNEIRKKHGELISTGKFINAITQQNRASHIDDLANPPTIF